MTESLPPRVKVLTDAAQLPAAERDYYRTIWGFDPEGDCRALGEDKFRYEACFPLEQDPPLNAHGITICARVEWHCDEIHNRIVFRQGSNEAGVECIHTVATPIVPAGLSKRDLGADGSLEDLHPLKLEKPPLLPPWEHFAALKSYVAAIAEFGIATLLIKSITLAADDGIPFQGTPIGFNAEMHHQIGVALNKIAPETILGITHNICIELIDKISPVWVMDNWPSLSKAYPLKQIFSDDPGLFLAWVQRWAKLAPHLYVSWDTEKEFGSLFQRIGEKVFQTWDPNFIVHLFRLSNLCDEWQRHLFMDSQFKTRHFTIPWEDLEVEEEARKFAEKMEDEYYGPRPPPSVSINISSKTDITYKTPAVEIWPRAPFYAFEFPSYLLIPDIKERLRYRRARLKIFLREIAKNPDYPYLESWRKSFQWALPYYLKRKISPEERNTSIKLPLIQEETIAWASSEKSSKRYAVLSHGKIPEKLQSKLATHPDFATRLTLAVNPNVTSEILSQLASDIQPSVRAVAQTRIACGSSSFSAFLGEILSPGEILWLLVSHPAIFFEFGVTTWGDGSPTYRQWVSTQILRHPQWQYQIGGVFSWAYLGGMIFEEGERGDLPHHCALNGLSSLACGHWPCIFLGMASQPL